LGRASEAFEWRPYVWFCRLDLSFLRDALVVLYLSSSFAAFWGFN
jgi:hypothetical protein